MSVLSESASLARFRSIVADRFGLALEPARLDGVFELLERRARTNGMDLESYVARIEISPPEELSGLIPELIVSETYFFRHSQQFDALRALLTAYAARGGTAGPSLLCAGCATGEEAFSLAIALREALPSRAPPIVAVDLNAAALARARTGIFSAWALRETPPFRRARWFRQEGRSFHLDPSILESVRFRAGNLATTDPIVFAPGAYDIIFCRNVLMYFTPEQSRSAVARLHEALTPGGHLFLGSAETLRELSQDFDLCQEHGAFYYRKRASGALKSERKALADVRHATGDLGFAGSWRTCVTNEAEASLQAEPAWADAIAGAAARVLALTNSEAKAAPDRADGGAISPPRRAEQAGSTLDGLARRSDLREPLELLRRERFDAALVQVRALPAAGAVDGDVLLLEAVLLSSGGRLDEARSTCQRLLGLDQLNAGAHYVLALCDAETGAVEAAVHHHRTAMYLDPHFAMPRLQLGLLLRRAGQRGQARSELMHALSLLEHEDAARLTLFGGGFGRSALLELCAAELALTQEEA